MRNSEFYEKLSLSNFLRYFKMTAIISFILINKKKRKLLAFLNTIFLNTNKQPNNIYSHIDIIYSI